MILDRAPPADVVGGHAALRAAIAKLLDAWEAVHPVPFDRDQCFVPAGAASKAARYVATQLMTS
jgi:hypothetical protein